MVMSPLSYFPTVVVPVAVDKLESLPANNPVNAETLELDMKLEKLKISPSQSVIFPDHLQVPEAFKNQLTFGSLDGAFGGEGSSPVVESGQEIGEGAGEPSLR